MLNNISSNSKNNMNQDEFKFKSIQLAKEVNLSGDFIFVSAKRAMQLTSLHNEFDINTILYNGAVGVERLQKIYLYLCLDDPFIKHEELITHNHCELEKKVAKESGKSLRDNDIALIAVFNEYYSQYRYGNYEPTQKTKTVINMFISFLKRLNGKVNLYEPIVKQQFDQFKRFYINTLGNIANHYYELIREKSYAIGSFTYELDSLSNASRVFWTIDSLYNEILLEQQAVKELFLYFYKSHPRKGVFRLLNDLNPIQFDDALINDFLSELSDGKTNHMLTDWVYEMYLEIDDEKELKHRKEIISLIGNRDVDYYWDEETKNEQRIIKHIFNKFRRFFVK